MHDLIPWFVLIAHVLVLLLLDFFVLHRKNTVPSVKRALFESIFFVGNALLFTAVIFWFYSNGWAENTQNLTPSRAVIKYITGYLIELSLSVDNLFVIAIIFSSFKIPREYQHRLLFLGILGAIVFRALLISIGIVLINRFESMSIIFGLFLLFTAFKMLKKESENEQTEEPKGLSRFFRFSKELDGGKYVTVINGKRVFTALAGALITIEFTDLIFALDSIPAIFSISTDPYLVYSSNIFAILGLRSLYFFLSNMLEKFHYIKYSVFAILIFVSLKLMSDQWIDIPEWFSLIFIGLSLTIGVFVSLRNKA